MKKELFWKTLGNTGIKILLSTSAYNNFDVQKNHKKQSAENF